MGEEEKGNSTTQANCLGFLTSKSFNSDAFNHISDGLGIVPFLF